MALVCFDIDLDLQIFNKISREKIIAKLVVGRIFTRHGLDHTATETIVDLNRIQRI